MSRRNPLGILLVSNREGVHRRLGGHLRRLGHQVEEAYQPLYALQVVRRGRLEVVLLDLSLPEQDALAFLEHLGQIRPEISAVVMAEGTGDPLVIRALGLGAAEVLDGSLDLEELGAFLYRESLLRSSDIQECEGRPVAPEAPPPLSPGQEALEESLEEVCHPRYRGLSWLERTLEFCQAFDLVRRTRLYLLHTFFQQLGPRWRHPDWPLLNRARRQADALGADYQLWVDVQFERLLGQGRSEPSPADLQGQVAAQDFLKKSSSALKISEK